MPSKRLSALQRKKENSSEGTADTNTVSPRTPLHANMNSNKTPKAMLVKEFEDLFLENRGRGIQTSSRKFTYIYSEGYQNIEKLLTSVGKSLKARSTFAEFRIIEDISRKKIEKGLSEKSRGYERRDSGLAQTTKHKRNR